MHTSKRHSKNSNRKTRKNKAFTLVELIVVVVIIAILIGVTIKGIYGYVTSSKRNTDVANAAAMQDAMSSLALDDEVCEYLENENIALGTTWTATWRKPSNVDWGEFPEKIRDKILEMVNNELPEAKKKKNFTLTATNTARGLDVTVSAGTTATDSIIIDVASNDTGDKENTGGVGGTGGNTGTGTGGNIGTGGSNTGTGSGTGGAGTGGGSNTSGSGNNTSGSGSNTSGGAQNGVGNTETGEVSCTNGTTEHDYKVEITREATCDKAGEKSITCTRCGHTYTSIIKCTGHSWNENYWCTRTDCGKNYFQTLTWKKIKEAVDNSDTDTLSKIRVGHTKECAGYTWRIGSIDTENAVIMLSTTTSIKIDNKTYFTKGECANILINLASDFQEYSLCDKKIIKEARLPYYTEANLLYFYNSANNTYFHSATAGYSFKLREPGWGYYMSGDVDYGGEIRPIFVIGKE